MCRVCSNFTSYRRRCGYLGSSLGGILRAWGSSLLAWHRDRSGSTSWRAGLGNQISTCNRAYMVSGVGVVVVLSWWRWCNWCRWTHNTVDWLKLFYSRTAWIQSHDRIHTNQRLTPSVVNRRPNSLSSLLTLSAIAQPHGPELSSHNKTDSKRGQSPTPLQYTVKCSIYTFWCPYVNYQQYVNCQWADIWSSE